VDNIESDIGDIGWVWIELIRLRIRWNGGFFFFANRVMNLRGPGSIVKFLSSYEAGGC
jgi:hypothetical protein